MKCLLALAVASNLGFHFTHRPLAIEHYQAHGNTSEAAIDDCEKRGPQDPTGQRYPALTSYRCHYQASFSKAPIRLQGLSLTMAHTMILPRLQPPLPGNRAWVWRDWHQRLMAHEQKHYHLATQPWIQNRFRMLFQDFSNHSFASEAQGQARLHREVGKILSHLDQQEQALDQQTHHGDLR